MARRDDVALWAPSNRWVPVSSSPRSFRIELRRCRTAQPELGQVRRGVASRGSARRALKREWVVRRGKHQQRVFQSSAFSAAKIAPRSGACSRPRCRQHSLCAHEAQKSGRCPLAATPRRTCPSSEPRRPQAPPSSERRRHRPPRQGKRCAQALLCRRLRVLDGTARGQRVCKLDTHEDGLPRAQRETRVDAGVG
jgi:hypothetical protein